TPPRNRCPLLRKRGKRNPNPAATGADGKNGKFTPAPSPRAILGITAGKMGSEQPPQTRPRRAEVCAALATTDEGGELNQDGGGAVRDNRMPGGPRTAQHFR